MSESLQSTPGDPNDPISAFIEELRLHGRTERTRAMYDRILTRFATHAGVNEHAGIQFQDVDRTQCMEWVHSLRQVHKDSTIATYASTVNLFYQYMMNIGWFESNPMALVVEQMDESVDTDPVRRDISIHEMRTFLAEIDHPLTKAVVLTLAKTGMRVGELCNLDRRDISIQLDAHEGSNEFVRGQLVDRQRALFVDSEPAMGEEYNGERRSASNKRHRPSIIPVDDELEYVLRRWLAIRPDPVSDAQPLFIDTREHWGERLTPNAVRYRLRKHASPIGWHTEGADPAENVTPHYFRHFFTTHMRDRIGDRGIVKYLRGDVSDDVIDTYTHNWGDRVRQRYLENIYPLL